MTDIVAATIGFTAEKVPMQHVTLWDLPLRLFHWGLVIAVAGALITLQLGGNLMIWHERFGLAVIGLLTFRLVWGVIGPYHARFITFFPTPVRLRAYLRGEWQGTGHNPLGALSVFALLGVFGWQAISGLFSYDDIGFGGPLRSLVSGATVERLSGLHRDGEWWLYGLIALHVLAILVYALRGRHLTGAMIHGRTPVDTIPAALHSTHRATVRWPALVIALVIAAAAVWLASGVWIDTPPPAPAAPAPAAPAW